MKGPVSEMSLGDFLRSLMEDYEDDLNQIAELEKLLDKIRPPKENNQIYQVSVTTNW